MTSEFIAPIGLIVLGVLVLWLGAEWLVRSSQTLAIRSGISPLVTGLTVVAFGTSAPEMLASIVAGIDGSTDMALGNVIGSNISNIGLVLGLAAVITPIVVHRNAVRVDGPVALISTAVVVFFLYNGELSRLEGLLLIAGILGYTILRLRETGALSAEVDETASEEMPDASNGVLAAVLVVSLVGLGIGSYMFVEGAQKLAVLARVSEAVVGLTIMAVGTSLPEIATVIAAARKGLSDLVIGNVVGSNIFNILSVLGVASTIIPLQRQDVGTTDLIVFGGSALLLVALLSRPKIGRFVGAGLLVGYTAYVVYLYLV